MARRDEDDDDDDVDDDRPRKKSRRDDDDEDVEPRQPIKGAKPPMPTRLAGAIMVAFALGFLSLHTSCLQSGGSIFSVIQHHKMIRDMEDANRMFRMGGVNERVGFGTGEVYTHVAINLFRVLTALLLVVGAIVLLMRKGFGKYVAMAAPILMMLVELIGMIVFLIFSRGTFLLPHNVGFLVGILFNLVCGAAIIFLLLNKDVSKALK